MRSVRGTAGVVEGERGVTSTYNLFTFTAFGVLAVMLIWQMFGDSARCPYCGAKDKHNDSCPNNYRL